MAPDTLIFWYLTLLLGALAAVGIYYERRQRRFGPAPSRDNLFRCRSCGSVYTDDADVDRSRCPHCGTMNEEFEF
jgi:rubrerythrin